MEKAVYLEIRRRTDLRSRHSALIWHLVQDLLLLGFATGLWFTAPPWWRSALLVPLAVAFIFRSFSLMHEAVHRVASPRRRWNDFAGLWGGAVCLLPFEPWRRSHLEHHHWSGNADRDPVMALVKYIPSLRKMNREGLTVLWKMWLPVIALLQHGVFWKLSFAQLRREHGVFMTVSVLAPFVLWGVLGFLASSEFVLGVMLPSLLVYMVLVEVVNLPHHLQLTALTGDQKLPLWRQYETARSCLYPRWMARFVVLNFNYHAEHHMFPDAPWYTLDHLHHEITGTLGEQLMTDAGFAWIRRNRPQHLDDVIISGQGAASSFRQTGS